MSSKPAMPAYFGRYQVLEELGAGAMGVVYLAVDPRLARPVAIKVMKESEFMGGTERDQFQARFRQEAEAAGRLNHPDIVQIYDIGPSYLVMEFVEGRPLAAALKAGTTLRVNDIVAMLQRVSDAIDYAHRNGIVHRDIKPANIMLLEDGAVKVMDFGVARLESSTLTAVGTVLGSVRYMAPEQMMGERVDARADIFSLAAVAYELLTGQLPFPGKSITEVVSRVVHGSHVPVSQVDARFPDALSGVFERAFARRPDERFSRAMDFSRTLQECLEVAGDLEIHHRGEGPSAPSSSRSAPLQPSTLPGETLLLPGPVVGQALLMLDSDPPGARVFIDDHLSGQTPISGIPVSIGRHALRLEASGRGTVQAHVEIGGEHLLKALTFTLPLARDPSDVARPGQLVSFGPEVTAPRRISGAIPVYPEIARARGVEGSPVADLWVGESGAVLEATIVDSAGPILDAALLEAVSSWTFSPAVRHGIPVSVRIRVQHHFRS